MKKIKINDLFEFRYDAEIAKEMFSPYHCFDGQLVVKEREGGELYLEDTYWTTQNKCFTLKEALEVGKLTFICNLDEVETVHKMQFVYYEDKDTFDLSTQHGYSKKYAIKKDAKRSKTKMLKVVNDKIEESKREISSLKRAIELANVNLEEIKTGNLEIYI